MVDFQERDTRRDLGGSGDGDDASDDSPERDGERASDEDRDRGHDDHEHGHDQHEHGHDHEPGHEHDDDHHHDHDVETLGAAVVTVSSTRTIDDDSSGDAIRDAFEEAGHEVVTRELVADDLDGIQRTVDGLVDRGDVDVVVTTGGTGVTPDDVTVEAVAPLFEKQLPGFGELFRRRSEDAIGTRVIATRATAGVAAGVPVFCLPGSEGAARDGAEILVPEAGHVAGLARRDDSEE